MKKVLAQFNQFQWIFSRAALVALWLPVILISVAHFATPVTLQWLHDVLRRLYYIPIIVGAFMFGLRGAAVTSLFVTVLYFPHAFMSHVNHHHHAIVHHDPSSTANKLLELLLYNVVAVVTGFLAERELKARKALEQKMIEMQAMETQLIRAGRLQALGELTAGLAHEIKNPLASLKTASAIVSDEIPTTSPRRKMVGIIQKELDRLEALLERFLCFARPDKLQLSDIDLVHAVEQIIALANAQVELRQVRIDWRPPHESLHIMGDPGKLSQILLNVLLNAVQFTDPGGIVRVRCESSPLAHGDYASVTIRDEGPGIDNEIKERIFDPFFSTRENGTGLGLSIASRLIDEHKGFIEANNTEPRGAEFRLYFPLVV